MKIKWSKWLYHTLILLLIMTAGCKQVKKIVNWNSPREAFAEALKNSPLKDKPFVKEWKNAWPKAGAKPMEILLPYQERGVFFPSDPNANAFLFSAQKGENIIIRIGSPVNVFAEIYRNNDLEKPIAYFKEDESVLKLEIESSGNYVLIFQPELLASGHYKLTVSNEASVAFPVLGKNSDHIKSFWGAVRDGGKRQHQGVDIFAPRGTPVLAVAPGVARASSNRLGGKVIWHRTDKGQNFYYAHLDSQAISRKRVKVGDTLGFVGNTGNAKYTPPHLHFGIYLSGRGAVDPFPYINNIRPEIPIIKADTNWQEPYARISGIAANFRPAPSIKSKPDTILRQNTIVAIKSAAQDWYRVALPDGKGGFVHASLIDALQWLPNILPDSNFTAFINPWSEELALDSHPFDETPEVFGWYDEHFLAKHPSGKFLWLKPL